MKKMVCSICSYTYDEAKGIPEAGIAPGTRWEDLPADWKCPWCGASKDLFEEKRETPAEPVPAPEESVQPAEEGSEDRQLTAMEMSILCSNLARGCEKQYMPAQEQKFRVLADFFRAQAEPLSGAGSQELLRLVEEDLAGGYPQAYAAARAEPDRGALRALVWSEKVTRMLRQLLARYETEGEKMLENTGVYVCTVCGFVYIGDAPPKICPVCKVPDWKFERVERRV